MGFSNYHTHTQFCDGANPPEEYIIAAIDWGMSAIGFSAHSPLPFENNYSIKESRLLEYRSAISELKEKYKEEINIFLSFEYDYVPGISESCESLKQLLKPDYIIASVHLVRNPIKEELWFIDGPDTNYISGLENIFNNNIEKAVTCYYKQIQEMVCSVKPDIVGHLDKIKMNNKNRFFTEDEKWYRQIVSETLHVIAETGSIVEVNTRGIYKKRSKSLFPGNFILEEILQKKIPILVSADAHAPAEVCMHYPETIEILRKIGFKSIKKLEPSGWKDELI